MTGLAIFLIEFSLVVLVCWSCHRTGFKSGYQKALSEQDKFGKECYQRGRSDESSWWIAADLDVNAERQSMWKREHGR